MAWFRPRRASGSDAWRGGKRLRHATFQRVRCSTAKPFDLSADPDDYLTQAELLDRTSSRQTSLLHSLQQKQREIARK